MGCCKDTKKDPKRFPKERPNEPICPKCGYRTRKVGNCFTCPNCGTTHGGCG